MFYKANRVPTIHAKTFPQSAAVSLAIVAFNTSLEIPVTYLSRGEKFCQVCQPITHLCNLCLQTVRALGSMAGSESLAPSCTPGPPALATTDRLVCCSYCQVRHDVIKISTQQEFYLVAFPDLAHEVAERLVDVDTLLR